MSEEIKIKEAALNSVASSIMDITQGLGSESISNLDNMSTIDGNKASINSYDEIKDHKEMEYESEQEAQIEREYYQLQALLDSANGDSRLQGILCESLDVIANIKQRRFEIMDDLHTDKQSKIRESEENIQEAKKYI